MEGGGVLSPVRNDRFALVFLLHPYFSNNSAPPPPPTTRKFRGHLEELAQLWRWALCFSFLHVDVPPSESGQPTLAGARTTSSASATASPVNGALFPSARRETELIYRQ